MTLCVPDDGYSRNVPDDGYSSNVPDDGYSSNVPDDGYSRNASCVLYLTSTFLLKIQLVSIKKPNTNNMIKSPESMKKTTTSIMIRQITIGMVE